MTTNYPPIPAPLDYQPQAESHEQYGWRMLDFVMRHGTATCTNTQLEDADHHFPSLIHGLRDTTPQVLARLVDARRQALQTLRWRDVEKQSRLALLQQQAAQASSQPAQDSNGPSKQGIAIPPRSPRPVTPQAEPQPF